MQQDALDKGPGGPPNTALLLTLLCGRYDVRGQEWPDSGAVVATKWAPDDPSTGLVGVLWGEGIPDEAPVEFNRWVVWEASQTGLADLANGEFRSASGKVLYCGDQEGASEYLLSHGCQGRPIVGLVANLKDGEGVEGGYYSRIFAGHDARIRVEHASWVSAGDRAFVSPRSECRVRVGDDSAIMGDGAAGFFVLGDRCGFEGDVSSVQVYAGRGAGICVGGNSHVEAGAFSHVTLGDRSWFRVGFGTEVDHLTSAYSRDCERTKVGTAGIDLTPGALYFVSGDGKATLVEGRPVSPTSQETSPTDGLRVGA